MEENISTFSLANDTHQYVISPLRTSSKRVRRTMIDLFHTTLSQRTTKGKHPRTQHYNWLTCRCGFEIAGSSRQNTCQDVQPNLANSASLPTNLVNIRTASIKRPASLRLLLFRLPNKTSRQSPTSAPLGCSPLSPTMPLPDIEATL